MGVVQSELIAKVGNDSRVISLGLAEAWPCATPAAVRAALGWKANSSERNGVAIVARYGFAGPERWTQLDTSLNINPADTMWVLRVPGMRRCRLLVQRRGVHLALVRKRPRPRKRTR